jgi:hypothetical protein
VAGIYWLSWASEVWEDWKNDCTGGAMQSFVSGIRGGLFHPVASMRETGFPLPSGRGRSRRAGKHLPDPYRDWSASNAMRLAPTR